MDYDVPKQEVPWATRRFVSTRGTVVVYVAEAKNAFQLGTDQMLKHGTAILGAVGLLVSRFCLAEHVSDHRREIPRRIHRYS